jgi:hypothetical protein
MSTESVPLTAPGEPRSRLMSRLSGLAVLAAFAFLLIWGVVITVRAFTDSWVAPIYLSPDNDAVIQLRLNLSRQHAEFARADAELKRIDLDIDAVDKALDRLSGLRSQARRTFNWQATVQGEEGRVAAQSIEYLRSQREILQRLHERQERLTVKTREDLSHGLIDRTELEKQEQALDTLAVQLVENQRMLGEAELKQRQSNVDTQAYRSAFAKGGDTNARKPEVAAGEEHSARVELELIKLEAEKRGLEEIRRSATETVAKQRELLEEIKTRPLYRAMSEGTEVAFVPYSQSDGVETGSRVLSCIAGLFRCRDVGRVTEVLNGEVITQDPWGNPARGFYAVLNLSDPEAIREKVLRIRQR